MGKCSSRKKNAAVSVLKRNDNETEEKRINKGNLIVGCCGSTQTEMRYHGLECCLMEAIEEKFVLIQNF